MNRYPVWLDCDAGVDDAIALIALHTLEELDLQGISAVCGNAALSDTYRNVHRINGLLGAHYPVYRGADRPLFRELHVSEAFHGRDGLGDVDLPVPPHEDSETAAWDALYACAKAHPGELQLVATGPLTNLAIAFAKYRELPGLLGRILLMGGSASAGNITPAAEFNIYDDPEAASVVFQAGVPLVMCGLDVTLKALLRPADWDELAAEGTRAGVFVRECLKPAWKFLQGMGFDGVPMHDACPVLYLAHPELFRGETAGVHVETRGELTLGKTVTDLYSDKQFEDKNALVVLDVDRDRFIAILKDCVRRAG